MLGKNKIKLNVVTSLISQMCAIVYGLIIPRLILTTFGSEINGLISSITQFLSYITLLEGGLMGVIMASLYKPLVDGDNDRVSSIFNASKKFFRQIAKIYILYTAVFTIIYPFKVQGSFEFLFVSELIVVIALTLFIQYFYSLNLKILILASQNGYIVYISQIMFNLVNLFFTLIVINIFPNIIVLKLASVIAFSIQPLVYSIFLKYKFPIKKNAEPDSGALSQRWDAFGQNLAYFVHSNTDVVVLTLFATLFDVSIYTTYLLVINAVKTLVLSVSSAIVPSIGQIMVSGDDFRKNTVFDRYEFGITILSTFGFGCCIILIVPFIAIYTRGINDANYIQLYFGVLMTIAEYCYCLREPYVSAAYVCGKFKETSQYAYVEAILNIVISVVLVSRWGIIGVAIGTLTSMLYRMICHVLYLKKNILYRSVKLFWKNLLPSVLVMITATIISKFTIRLVYLTAVEWLFMAIMVALLVSVEILILFYLFRREIFLEYKNIVLSKMKQNNAG